MLSRLVFVAAGLIASAVILPGCDDDSLQGVLVQDGSIQDAECRTDLYFRAVCGEDGKTYSNEEIALFCARVKIAHVGPCGDAG